MTTSQAILQHLATQLKAPPWWTQTQHYIINTILWKCNTGESILITYIYSSDQLWLRTGSPKIKGLLLDLADPELTTKIQQFLDTYTKM